MTLVIPVKRRDATSLGEFTSADQLPPIYVAGLLGRNLLINADMQINQRGFAGGALAAGVYGYDRWKAGTGGCNVSVNASGVVTHTSGPLVQIVESPLGVYGANVTFSVQDPSGTVNVSVGGVSGSITAGSGRRSATLAIPSGSGDLTVQITAAGVTYKLPQLERGDASAGFDARPLALELGLCQRYYEEQMIGGTCGGITAAGQVLAYISPFKVQKRVTPAITLKVDLSSNAFPSGIASIFNQNTVGFGGFKTSTAGNSNAGWYQVVAADSEF